MAQMPMTLTNFEGHFLLFDTFIVSINSEIYFVFTRIYLNMNLPPITCSSDTSVL